MIRCIPLVTKRRMLKPSRILSTYEIKSTTTTPHRKLSNEPTAEELLAGFGEKSSWESIQEESYTRQRYRPNTNTYIGQRQRQRQIPKKHFEKPLKDNIQDYLNTPFGNENASEFQKVGIQLIHKSASLNTVIGVEQCELLLKRLIKEKHWYDTKKYSRRIVIDIKLYNFLINLWGKVPNMKNSDKVMRVLKVFDLIKREEKYDLDFMNNELSTISFESSIDRDLYYTPTKPDRLSYTFLISACAGAGDLNQAKLYLQQLVKKYTESKDVNFVPPVAVFGSILSAMAAQAAPGDGKQAYKMLQLMKQLHVMVRKDHPDQDITCQPDAQAYAVVMDTFIKSREPDFPDVVEKLLQEMIDAYTSGDNLHAKPDIPVMTTVIKAWTQAAPLKLHAPKKAEKWLLFLIDQYTLGKQQNNDDSKILKPTTEIFNMVLNAYTQSNREDAITRSEVVFQKFIHLTQKDKSFPAKPDTTSFNTLLNCYAKHKGKNTASTTKVEKLLKQMEVDYKLIPDNYTYCTIFKYWMRSREKLKVQRCKQLLDSIEERYQNYVNSEEKEYTIHPPSNAVYTSVINVCTSLGRQGYYSTQEEKQAAYDTAKEIFYNFRSKNKTNTDFYMYLSIFQAVFYLLPNTTKEERSVFREELWGVMKCCVFDKCLNESLDKKLRDMLQVNDYNYLMRKKEDMDDIEELMD